MTCIKLGSRRCVLVIYRFLWYGQTPIEGLLCIHKSGGLRFDVALPPNPPYKGGLHCALPFIRGGLGWGKDLRNIKQTCAYTLAKAKVISHISCQLSTVNCQVPLAFISIESSHQIRRGKIAVRVFCEEIG